MQRRLAEALKKNDNNQLRFDFSSVRSTVGLSNPLSSASFKESSPQRWVQKDFLTHKVGQVKE